VPLLAALAAVAVEAALQVQVLPAQVEDLAAPPPGEQVGEDQGPQTEAWSRLGGNHRQQSGHLLGAQAPGPGVGLAPRRPDALAGVVLAQAFGAGSAVEAAQAGQLRGLRGGRERSLPVPPPPPPVSGQEALQVGAFGLQGVDLEAEQPLQGVQVGVGPVTRIGAGS
jgi:hypothetical protein